MYALDEDDSGIDRLAEAIAHHRAWGEQTAVETRQLRTRKDVLLTDAAFLVYMALQAGCGDGPAMLDVLERALQRREIAPVKRRKSATRLAWLVMGPDAEQTRVHRVSSAGRELHSLSPNEPRKLLEELGVSKLAKDWKARNADPVGERRKKLRERPPHDASTGEVRARPELLAWYRSNPSAATNSIVRIIGSTTEILVSDALRFALLRLTERAGQDDAERLERYRDVAGLPHFPNHFLLPTDAICLDLVRRGAAEVVMQDGDPSVLEAHAAAAALEQGKASEAGLA